ncbi:MAG: putative quinol monooxygenase [Rhizobacter sp.]
MTAAVVSEAIVVVARWQVSDGSVRDVLAHVAELREASLAEPGCLGYEVYQALGVPGQLLLREQYRDDAALEAHRKSPHYQALVVGRILPLLAGRQVELLRARDTG